MADLQAILHKYKSLLFCYFWLVQIFIGCNAQHAMMDSPGSSVDRIHHAICTGVNVYERQQPCYESIFSICPTSMEVSEFLTLGSSSQSRVFGMTKLNPELVETGKAKTLAQGVKEFVGQFWDQNPVHVQMTPYDAISSGYRAVGLRSTAVRNMLLYGHNDRVNEYKRRSAEADLATYVAGRAVVSEHFRVEWLINPNKFHLSQFFRQRASQLTSSPASIDRFIRDFGTHYRRSVTFGGMFGADFYFSGYGTHGDKLNAVQHVLSADMRATQNSSYT